MFRALVIFTLLSGFVAEVRADIPPSPPPPGRKYVAVHNEVRLGKEIDDYVFFIAQGQGPGPPRYEYRKVTLSTKSSTPMPAGGRHQYVRLLAVPKDSASQVRSDSDGFGVSGRDVFEIAGLKSLGFGDTETIAADHPRGSLTRTYTITGFGKDRKIETTVEREPGDPEGKKEPAPDAEQKSNSRADVGLGAAAPDKTRSVVAGIALALSLAVGGFLLVRKRRAPVEPARD